MPRTWTLQELLSAAAPGIVFFYDTEWKPYLARITRNPQGSYENQPTLSRFPVGLRLRSPQTTLLNVREKLRPASTRNATVKEDITYRV